MGLKFWSLRVRVCSEMYTKYENNYLSLISPLKIFHQPQKITINGDKFIGRIQPSKMKKAKGYPNLIDQLKMKNDSKRFTFFNN